MNAVNDKYKYDEALINDKLQSDIEELQLEANKKIAAMREAYVNTNRKYANGFKFNIRVKNKLITEVAEIRGAYFRCSNRESIGYYFWAPSFNESVLKKKGYTITEQELDVLVLTITNEIDHMKRQLNDEIQLKIDKYINENRKYLDGFEFHFKGEAVQVCEAKLLLVESPLIYYICYPTEGLNHRIKGEGLDLSERIINDLLK